MEQQNIEMEMEADALTNRYVEKCEHQVHGGEVDRRESNVRRQCRRLQSMVRLRRSTRKKYSFTLFGSWTWTR